MIPMWKWLLYTFASIFVVSLFFRGRDPTIGRPPVPDKPAGPPPNSHGHLYPNGKYITLPGDPDVTLPADLFGEISEVLTQEQCDAGFPDLWAEIDRSKGYWRDIRQHEITADDLAIGWRSQLKFPDNGGAVRFLIHENELRILETSDFIVHPGHRSRGISVLEMLLRALDTASLAGELLPTIEAVIIVNDVVNYPDPGDVDATSSYWTWNMNDTETHKRHWLIPNFDFHTGTNKGTYREARRAIAAHDATIPSWRDKIPKLVWRGTVWFNPIRGLLLEATKDKDWADAKSMDWGTMDTFMPIDRMCDYAFNMHTEGGSYSGRLKFLLMCSSPVVVHELDWTTHWYHLLVAEGDDQNYISVQRDFSDLEEKVQHYLENPEEAERIIENARTRLRDRYLTPAAQLCYWKKLIRGYSEVSFTPEVYRRPKEEGYPWGDELPRKRGMCWQEFLASMEDLAPGVVDV